MGGKQSFPILIQERRSARTTTDRPKSIRKVSSVLHIRRSMNGDGRQYTSKDNAKDTNTTRTFLSSDGSYSLSLSTYRSVMVTVIAVFPNEAYRSITPTPLSSTRRCTPLRSLGTATALACWSPWEPRYGICDRSVDSTTLQQSK